MAVVRVDATLLKEDEVTSEVVGGDYRRVILEVSSEVTSEVVRGD